MTWEETKSLFIYIFTCLHCRWCYHFHFNSTWLYWYVNVCTRLYLKQIDSSNLIYQSNIIENFSYTTMYMYVLFYYFSSAKRFLQNNCASLNFMSVRILFALGISSNMSSVVLILRFILWFMSTITQTFLNYDDKKWYEKIYLQRNMIWFL